MLPKSKCLFSAAWLGLVLLAIPSQGQPEPDSPQKPLDDVLNKTVTLQLQDKQTDDALLELARSANINIMADSTHLGGDAPTTFSQREHPLKYVVGELAKQRTLTWFRSADRTLLFWKEPDIYALARKIGANLPFKPVDEVLSRWDMERLIAEYLRRSYEWDIERWNGVDRGHTFELPLTLLPFGLRKKVIAKAQDNVFQQNVGTLRGLWFQDAFWTKARLRIQPNRLGGSRLHDLLQVGGSVEQRNGQQVVNGGGGAWVTVGVIDK